MALKKAKGTFVEQQLKITGAWRFREGKKKEHCLYNKKSEQLCFLFLVAIIPKHHKLLEQHSCKLFQGALEAIEQLASFHAANGNMSIEEWVRIFKGSGSCCKGGRSGPLWENGLHKRFRDGTKDDAETKGILAIEGCQCCSSYCADGKQKYREGRLIAKVLEWNSELECQARNLGPLCDLTSQVVQRN